MKVSFVDKVDVRVKAIPAEHKIDSNTINELKQVVNANASAQLQLPSKIWAVTGHTLQVFFRGISYSSNPANYHYRCTCAVGKQFHRYFELTASVPGVYTLTIEQLDKDLTIMATATTQLIVTSSVQQPSSMVNAWCIGDSLTQANVWSTELNRMLTGAGGAPSAHGYSNIQFNVEGHSGKQWNWFIYDENSPFVHSGVLSFETYRANESLAVPNAMYVLLTWNGMGAIKTNAAWVTWKSEVLIFIDKVHQEFPNCKIKLMSPQIPSTNGGLGFDYGALGDGHSDLMTGIMNAKTQAKIYEEIASDDDYSDFVEHLETATQFDSDNNMPEALKPVNTRNSKTEWVGSNGVHPSTAGYYQIADVAYRNYIANYCQ